METSSPKRRKRTAPALICTLIAGWTVHYLLTALRSGIQEWFKPPAATTHTHDPGGRT